MTVLRTAAAAISALALGAAFTIAPGAAHQKLKVHISVDMEGVGGVVTAEQLGPSGFEYGRFREFMTREALDNAGATTRIVSPADGQVQGWNHYDKGDMFTVGVPLAEANADDFDALLLRDTSPHDQ